MWQSVRILLLLTVAVLTFNAGRNADKDDATKKRGAMIQVAGGDHFTVVELNILAARLGSNLIPSKMFLDKTELEGTVFEGNFAGFKIFVNQFLDKYFTPHLFAMITPCDFREVKKRGAWNKAENGFDFLGAEIDFAKRSLFLRDKTKYGQAQDPNCPKDYGMTDDRPKKVGVYCEAVQLKKVAWDFGVTSAKQVLAKADELCQKMGFVNGAINYGKEGYGRLPGMYAVDHSGDTEGGIGGAVGGADANTDGGSSPVVSLNHVRVRLSYFARYDFKHFWAASLILDKDDKPVTDPGSFNGAVFIFPDSDGKWQARLETAKFEWNEAWTTSTTEGTTTPGKPIIAWEGGKNQRWMLHGSPDAVVIMVPVDSNNALSANGEYEVIDELGQALTEEQLTAVEQLMKIQVDLTFGEPVFVSYSIMPLMPAMAMALLRMFVEQPGEAEAVAKFRTELSQAIGLPHQIDFSGDGKNPGSSSVDVPPRTDLKKLAGVVQVLHDKLEALSGYITWENRKKALVPYMLSLTKTPPLFIGLNEMDAPSRADLRPLLEDQGYTLFDDGADAAMAFYTGDESTTGVLPWRSACRRVCFGSPKKLKCRKKSFTGDDDPTGEDDDFEPVARPYKIVGKAFDMAFEHVASACEVSEVSSGGSSVLRGRYIVISVHVATTSKFKGVDVNRGRADALAGLGAVIQENILKKLAPQEHSDYKLILMGDFNIDQKDQEMAAWKAITDDLKIKPEKPEELTEINFAGRHLKLANTGTDSTSVRIMRNAKLDYIWIEDGYGPQKELDAKPLEDGAVIPNKDVPSDHRLVGVEVQASGEVQAS